MSGSSCAEQLSGNKNREDGMEKKEEKRRREKEKEKKSVIVRGGEWRGRRGASVAAAAGEIPAA